VKDLLTLPAANQLILAKLVALNQKSETFRVLTIQNETQAFAFSPIV